VREEPQTTSIYPLLLPGWEDLSTWGIDTDYFYAQLTHNGRSDDDGPDIWITSPNCPICRTAHELVPRPAESAR
jgi:hypothetical protein